MELLKLTIFFILCHSSVCQNLEESCSIPVNIPTSRLNRFHHRCESNRLRDFAIETRDGFYCVFYTTLEIALFESESKFEITVDGSWDYEQVGSRKFSSISSD